MDSNFTIKPRPAAAPRSHALRDPVTVRETADTELDPSRAVTPATDGGARHDHAAPHHDAPHHESHARDVVIDPNAREALFNAIDVRAENDEQSQNQVLMRQRAYAQTPVPKISTADGATDPDPHADIEA